MTVETDEAPTQQPEPCLPSILDNDEARRLLRLAQQAGWLDKAFQPSDTLSCTEVALLADAIAQRMERQGVVVKNPMALFGGWWKKTNLHKYRYRAMGQQKTNAFLDRLAEVLDSKDNKLIFSF